MLSDGSVPLQSGRAEGDFRESPCVARRRVCPEAEGPEITRGNRAFPDLARLMARTVQAFSPDGLQNVGLGGHCCGPNSLVFSPPASWSLWLTAKADILQAI